MDWTDIVIRVSIKDLDTASAIGQMAVPRGIYVEDYSNLEDELRQFGPVEIIEETLLQQDREHAKIHVYFSPERCIRDRHSSLPWPHNSKYSMTSPG